MTPTKRITAAAVIGLIAFGCSSTLPDPGFLLYEIEIRASEWPASLEGELLSTPGNAQPTLSMSTQQPAARAVKICGVYRQKSSQPNGIDPQVVEYIMKSLRDAQIKTFKLSVKDSKGDVVLTNSWPSAEGNRTQATTIKERGRH